MALKTPKKVLSGCGTKSLLDKKAVTTRKSYNNEIDKRQHKNPLKILQITFNENLILGHSI